MCLVSLREISFDTKQLKSMNKVILAAFCFWLTSCGKSAIDPSKSKLRHVEQTSSNTVLVPMQLRLTKNGKLIEMVDVQFRIKKMEDYLNHAYMEDFEIKNSVSNNEIYACPYLVADNLFLLGKTSYNDELNTVKISIGLSISDKPLFNKSLKKEKFRGIPQRLEINAEAQNSYSSVLIIEKEYSAKELKNFYFPGFVKKTVNEMNGDQFELTVECKGKQ
jgi:hypothetical protein